MPCSSEVPVPFCAAAPPAREVLSGIYARLAQTFPHTGESGYQAQGDHTPSPCASAWSPATQGWKAGTQPIIPSAKREWELSETITQAGDKHKLLPCWDILLTDPNKFTWHHFKETVKTKDEVCITGYCWLQLGRQ